MIEVIFCLIIIEELLKYIKVQDESTEPLLTSKIPKLMRNGYDFYYKINGNTFKVKQIKEYLYLKRKPTPSKLRKVNDGLYIHVKKEWIEGRSELKHVISNLPIYNLKKKSKLISLLLKKKDANAIINYLDN